MENQIVVYVEKEKFLRDMMEKAAMNSGFRLYTYGDQDCVHFIEDLKPCLLVLDIATVNEAFLNLVDTQIPIAITGTSAELEDFKSAVNQRIEKPLGPFDLIENILKIIAEK